MVKAWIHHFIQSADEGPVELIVAILIALPVLLLSLTFLRQRRNCSTTDALDEPFPKGPRPWPILGHLLLIKKAAHQVLADLSQNQGFGPIMGLRLGSQPAIVISSVELAKEVLLTHDKIFANRPQFRMADDLYFGYNSSVILSSYGPRLAWLRKVYAMELLTAKRMQQLQYIRQEELRWLLRAVQEAGGGGKQAVNVGKHVAEMAANTTARLLHSATLAKAAPDLPALLRTIEVTAVPTLGDFIPWLRFLDVFQVRGMRRAGHRLGEIIESMVSKRRQAMATLSSHDLPQDFLQVQGPTLL
ncbi:hypothetical protein L7F22_060812 [Adiantum nelumboides]|nr:hypothetical protein [Adiantum nelumboides]